MNKMLMNVIFFLFLIYTTTCLTFKAKKNQSVLMGKCTKASDCSYPYSCYIKIGGRNGYWHPRII